MFCLTGIRFIAFITFVEQKQLMFCGCSHKKNDYQVRDLYEKPGQLANLNSSWIYGNQKRERKSVLFIYF